MTTHTSNSNNPFQAPVATGAASHTMGEARARRSVYVITEKPQTDGSVKSFWTKVGAAFDNRDGSITLKLDALPVSGTLQIRDEDKDNFRRERAQSAPF